jgi:SH3-like domain-containing protein
MQAMVLRTADSAGAPAARVTPLPAGVEATLSERRGDWARIRLANGTTGWLPAGAIERVAR